MSYDALDALDLQDYEYMETDSQSQFYLSECIRSDPNLNVTSAPEHLDGGTTESSFSPVQGASAAMLYQDTEEPKSTLAELTTVVDQYDNFSFGADMQDGFVVPESFELASCDFPFRVQPVNCPEPATVTLVKPQVVVSSDPLTSRLLQELYTEETEAGSSEAFRPKEFSKDSMPLFRLSQPSTDATVNVPNLMLFEPLTLKPEVQTPAFDLASPSDSVDTGFTFASEDASSIGAAVTADREAEIDRMAAYIRDVIEKRGNKPDDMSSKLKVHEVILVILLNASHGDKSRDLQRILTFCDHNGKEATTGDCQQHFKTLDTETMGLLWQKIKGNKKGNYDTFARAMRVRRERSEGFFDYLDAGKGKKKRIYRLGGRSMEEMARFKKTLRQISRPQTCSY